MDLLFLLSDNAPRIINANGLIQSDVNVIKLDEKQLVTFTEIKRIIKGNDYSNIFFGCTALKYQRFKIFIKIYILIFSLGRGAIIDAGGNKSRFNIFTFLFIELTSLALELILSSIIVAWFYVKLPYLKWKLAKK
ncbi:MAG: hypothetical protein NT007_07295 [Candidatus Kapabacteria bacterium]|nr:hypothetical protein [Candidatus Kapabacteria bacterium]